MAPGLVCVTCQRFLKIKKKNVSVEEGMPNGVGGWQGYKLWCADLYECPDCGFQLITGFGRKAVSEHFMQDYAAWRGRRPPLVTVNDCGGARP